MPTPKEQPPRKLSGTRTARRKTLWKEAFMGLPLKLTDGVTAATGGKSLRFCDRGGAGSDPDSDRPAADPRAQD